MLVQENIKNFENAKALLEGHCLCFELKGNIVYLPDGYFPDGLKIDVSAKGFYRATKELEKIWKNSFL